MQGSKKDKPNLDFGPNNLECSVDDRGIVHLRFDSNRTVAKAGERKSNGEPRRRDMVATSGGFVMVGQCRVSLNVLR